MRSTTGFLGLAAVVALAAFGCNADVSAVVDGSKVVSDSIEFIVPVS
jgi:hypothetical protein